MDEKDSGPVIVIEREGDERDGMGCMRILSIVFL